MYRPMTPETASTDSANLQTFLVRLLFCDRTFSRYCENAEAIAAEFNLSPASLVQLPDCATPQLIAERHGRKMGVLSEIRNAFGQAYPLIEAIPEYRFENFLCDDAFFAASSGLPHPHGAGSGYENVSKFFFWARNRLAFSGSAARAEAGLMMKGDFAAYLIGLYKRGSQDFYRQFARGIYWREDTEHPLPIILMTAELHVFRLAEEAQRRALLKSGAVDLDRLSPGGNEADIDPI